MEGSLRRRTQRSGGASQRGMRFPETAKKVHPDRRKAKAPASPMGETGAFFAQQQNADKASKRSLQLAGGRQRAADIQNMVADPLKVGQHFGIKDTRLTGAGPVLQTVQLMLAEVQRHVVNSLLQSRDLSQGIQRDRVDILDQGLIWCIWVISCRAPSEKLSCRDSRICVYWQILMAWSLIRSRSPEIFR